jgi:hypothetical protein
VDCSYVTASSDCRLPRRSTPLHVIMQATVVERLTCLDTTVLSSGHPLNRIEYPSRSLHIEFINRVTCGYVPVGRHTASSTVSPRQILACKTFAYRCSVLSSLGQCSFYGCPRPIPSRPGMRHAHVTLELHFRKCSGNIELSASTTYHASQTPPWPGQSPRLACMQGMQ